MPTACAIIPLSARISPLTCCRACWKKRLFGARHVCLTGSEPRFRPQFEHPAEIIVEAGYKLNLVSNGQDIAPYLALFQRYPEYVTSVALSLDDADHVAHDRNRACAVIPQQARRVRGCAGFGAEAGIRRVQGVLLSPGAK